MKMLYIYFLVYSFIGFLVETTYVFIIDKKLVKRGFLHGPIIPIYGFGALAIIVSLSSFKNNIPLLFTLSILLTSSLEYITSYAMERMFQMRWWDYSQRKFNLNGRICLRNSLMFGILSLVLIRWLHPVFVKSIAKINPQTLNFITFSILILASLDWGHSMIQVLNFKKYLIEIEELKNKLQKHLKDQDILISFREFLEQREDFFENLNSPIKKLQKRFLLLNQRFINREGKLLKRFPHVTSKRFSKIIDAIKEAYASKDS